MTSLAKAAARVDELLAQLPADDETRLLQRRATAYARECGCTMGAVFFSGSIVGAVVYFATGGALGIGTAMLTVGVVVAATILGKELGLLVAAVKLVFLRRGIARRIRHAGTV